tara:strand:+ start:105 stop:473 length:369 start_codon:yes stop_codon:yes gene_type:complete
MNHVVVAINLKNYNTKINPLYCIEEIEEEEEEKVCRICLESNGHLISVCGCKGSVKYVHKECIEKWQKVAPTLESRTYCQLCKQKFEYENMHKPRKIYDSIVLCLLLSLICFTAIMVTVFLV